MWYVIYGSHYMYLNDKEHRFESKYYLIAILMYYWFYVRYVLSIQPVKYLKIYKATDNVIKLKSYGINYQGRKRK